MSGDVFRVKRFRTGNVKRARIDFFNTDANLAKLFNYGGEVQWFAVSNFQIASGNCRRRDEIFRIECMRPPD